MSENKISQISKNYAKALIEISKDNNSFVSVKTGLCNALDTVKESRDLKLVTDNSSISVAKKIEIIEEIFHNKIDDKVLNLLKILIEKNRFHELEGIVQAYNEMSDNFEQRKNVEIISSFDLDDDVKGQVLNKLEKKLNCEVVPEWTTDESIIGGLVFKFGDYVIDTSVKSKLENLSKYMLR